ncbi:ArnT family glycosyltransferase [Salinicola halophyticus]|uniref:ArnT family glycosyltransferase n=1 Tax=Salinicola halophyticus TaxID=1808881 RepID=UPI0013001F35|nr:glycosyltransferase family 39 protein [Salinicola halophyticus]
MIITRQLSHSLQLLKWESRHREAVVIALLWAMALVSALARPLMPIDETRYVSVAWEMWHAHSLWLPLMNGEPYADKPPLLFWLIQSGWSLFGVNAWWPKLISPLASLIAMTHLYRIARRLGYPGSQARLAPMALMAMLMWNLYSGALMFDILLSACLLGAIAPLVAGQLTLRKAIISGLWLGLALLAKGPAVFVTLGPILLTLPLWRARPLGAMGRRHLVVALSLGLAMLLAWALPAAWLGGRDYAQDLLWGQSVDRLQQAMAHARPTWWYLPWLALLAFPWTLWPPCWPRLPRHRQQRLAWIWLIGPLAVFSLISGKQIHYLMPLLPALALLIMDRLGTPGTPGTRLPLRSRTVPLAIALLGVTALILMAFGIGTLTRATLSPFGALALIAWAAVFWRQRWAGTSQAAGRLALGACVAVLIATQLMLAPLWSRYDVGAPGRLLAHLERENVPVAFVGNAYQATFQFAGHLTRPLLTLDDDPAALCRFRHRMPGGWVIGRDRDLHSSIGNTNLAHVFDYRGGELVVVPATALTFGELTASCNRLVPADAHPPHR